MEAKADGFDVGLLACPGGKEGNASVLGRNVSMSTPIGRCVAIATSTYSPASDRLNSSSEAVSPRSRR